VIAPLFTSLALTAGEFTSVVGHVSGVLALLSIMSAVLSYANQGVSSMFALGTCLLGGLAMIASTSPAGLQLTGSVFLLTALIISSLVTFLSVSSYSPGFSLVYVLISSGIVAFALALGNQNQLFTSWFALTLTTTFATYFELAAVKLAIPAFAIVNFILVKPLMLAVLLTSAIALPYSVLILANLLAVFLLVSLFSDPRFCLTLGSALLTILLANSARQEFAASALLSMAGVYFFLGFVLISILGVGAANFLTLLFTFALVSGLPIMLFNIFKILIVAVSDFSDVCTIALNFLTSLSILVSIAKFSSVFSYSSISGWLILVGYRKTRLYPTLFASIHSRVSPSRRRLD
jgi:hypothetical protein